MKRKQEGNRKKMIIEICCGSAEDAIASYRGGADRVELNSNLFLGGITPTIGSLLTVKKAAPDFPVMCMVRPREGGFCYTDTEFAVMLEDAKQLLAHGADGIVFGILKEDGTVDEERCRKMMEVIGDKPAVFHRAIDVVPDWRAALDTLIHIGVTRVLTSGQKPTVPEGSVTIREMLDYADGRIEILPGCGITPENAAWVKEMTGVSMMHAAMHRKHSDLSCSGNPAIYFGGNVKAPDGSEIYPPEDVFQITDSQDVQVFVNAAKKD